MQYKQIELTTIKTIRFETSLIEKINELADEAERDFSQQVRYMLKKYLQMIA